jgi:hypothetical protein
MADYPALTIIKDVNFQNGNGQWSSSGSNRHCSKSEGEQIRGRSLGLGQKNFLQSRSMINSRESGFMLSGNDHRLGTALRVAASRIPRSQRPAFLSMSISGVRLWLKIKK